MNCLAPPSIQLDNIASKSHMKSALNVPKCPNKKAARNLRAAQDRYLRLETASPLTTSVTLLVGHKLMPGVRAANVSN
jgi:hypothetical protein